MRVTFGKITAVMGCGFLIYGAVYGRALPILVGIAMVAVGAFVGFMRTGR
jgi:hypothetical protein